MDKLRIGIVIPETTPAWIARTVEYIGALPNVEISLVIRASAWHEKRGFYNTHYKIDRALFRPRPSALDECKESAPLEGIPLIHFNEKEPLSRLPAHKLDVIVNLALIEYPAIFVESARLGVWTPHDDKTRFVANSPIGWREPFEGLSITTCALEVERRGQSSQITMRAVLATDLQSVARNQNNLLWKASTIIPNALGQITSRYGPDFFSKAESVEINIPQVPANDRSSAFLMKQILDKLSEKIGKLFYRNQWRLLVKKGYGESLTLDGFQHLIPSKDRFWADPFVIEREGKTYLFIEELLYKTKRGRITFLALDEQGRVADNQVILERSYHLSYPFIFQHRGEIYMLPETSGNRSIELYRCTRFPDQWEFYKTLMKDVRAVDTTLFEYSGRWWMFTTIAEYGNSTWDALNLFYADDPLSDSWTPHPRNPVISDVRSARMAGRLFRHNGQLIRPSQDSSCRYGFALNLNRIITLTTTDYAETRVDRLEPPDGSNIQAVHTFNFSRNWTVMDMSMRTGKY